MSYVYDYSKLNGRISEKLGSKQKYAKELDISYLSLYKKMKNEREFKASEIVKSCEVLDIPFNEVGLYFFCIVS